MTISKPETFSSYIIKMCAAINDIKYDYPAGNPGASKPETVAIMSEETFDMILKWQNEDNEDILLVPDVVGKGKEGYSLRGHKIKINDSMPLNKIWINLNTDKVIKKDGAEYDLSN